MKHTEYIIPIGEEAKDFDEIFIGVLRKHKELIRCKDCKHRFEGEELHNCCEVLMEMSNWLLEIPVKDEWYCGSGERKRKKNEDTSLQSLHKGSYRNH